MAISQRLSILALRTMVDSAGRAFGVYAMGTAVDSVTNVLTQRFTDHADRLSRALTTAQQQAWKALEIALAGDSLWDRCKILLATGEQKGFREQVQKLLVETSFTSFAQQLTFKSDCLRELQAARQQGLLDGRDTPPAELAAGLVTFAKHAEPQTILEAEFATLVAAATELQQNGFGKLATLIQLRPPNGLPLLVIAVKYFFRRAVEDDPKLFQGLAFDQMEKLAQTQEQAFGNLHHLISKEGDRLAILLDDVLETIIATHEAVLDVQAEQRRQGEQVGDIYTAIVRMQEKLDQLNSIELRPRDSLSIRSDHERQLVKDLVLRYRALPDDQRSRLPALLNAVGKLEVAAGDFRSAQEHFHELAGMVSDRTARGEAHANAYRAALEQRDWPTALAQLRAAIDCEPSRFMPFPIDKYQPVKILGAGGFGVAFQCRHAYLNMDVVVKTLVNEELDRSVNEVFIEGQALRQIDHPAIIRLQDCGYADPMKQQRPYLVMDYFAGTTLDEQITNAGPLAVADFLQVALPMAEGLAAAHQRGILHRDVKPANLLVRQESTGWQIRLIDFGLALRAETMRTTLVSGRTLAGVTIAGTLDYAAPEQMGRSNEAIGPTADVYGFGKTCCYALFQTPTPLLRHWRTLPAALAELLESCMEESPRQRPQSMLEVVQRLREVQGGASSSPPPTMKAPRSPMPPNVIESSDLTTHEGRLRALTVLSQQVSSCTKCPELVRSRTQTVFGNGPLDVDLMFLGEAPGADEDRAGEPFIGAAGQLLNRLIEAAGLRRENIYIANVLKCRPPGNRQPQPTECTNCRPFLDRQLEIVKPKMIIALGSSAAQNLLNRAESIGKLRGKFFDYRGVSVLCTYHPAYLLPGRAPEKKKDVWEDFKLVLRRMGREVPATPYKFLNA